MFKKLRLVLAAGLLAVAGLGTTAPSVAAASNGFCVGNQWPPDKTGQWYYFKNAPSGSIMVQVDGWLTDRPLYPCEGLSYQGWSFAAAANVQGSGCDSPPCIFQLGFFQDGGNAGDQNYFVYTPCSGSGVATKISSPRPSFGNRYHFIVERISGVVTYWIYTVGGSLLWHLTCSFNDWPTMTTAWWGYETGNSRSLAGLDNGSAAADLVGYYRTNVVGSPLTLMKNISSTCFSPSGGPTCSQRASRVVSGSQNEIFNVYGLTTG